MTGKQNGKLSRLLEVIQDKDGQIELKNICINALKWNKNKIQLG